MWKKSMDEKFSRLMTVIFPRSTPPSRAQTLNAQLRRSEQASSVQRSMEPARPRAEDRCAHRAGHPVTQLAYARQGIITPEMEFIAIRENLGREILGSAGASPAPFGASPNGSEIARNDLHFRHAGSEPIGNWQIGNREIQSLPNSSAPKSRAVAPSFPQTSIIPNPSR